MTQEGHKKNLDGAFGLLDEMDTVVYVCDVKTQKLLYANKAAIKESRTQGDYHECTCYNYMFGRNSVCHDCQLRQLHEGDHQELVRHDEKGERYLNIEKKGIDWDGRLACAHFINDVTDKKRNEKIMAAEREATAKAAFASSVSHDMRTPLNGILGFTELAIETDGEEKKGEYLQKIQQTGKFMLSLINETLDFSKLEAGGFQLEPYDVDMADMLEGVLTPIRENAKLKGVKFLEQMQDCHFQQVRVDALKLQKVILNLLSNAVKYTPEGGQVTFLVEGPADFSGGYNCHICVQDTGMGMSKEFLPHLFQPFSQAQIKRPKNDQGTGLGMAIVKKLVDLLGGQLLVDSELGKGTQMDLYLWLDAEANEQKEQAAGMQHRPYEDLAGKKILLAEDNEINRELLEILLTAKQIEVTAVEDGQQAVAAFADSEPEEFAAVILDMHMPVMDGCTAAKAIRDMSREDAQTVPIFALSGAAEAQDREASKAAGMDYHLEKPVEINELLGRLQEMAGRADAEK